MARKSKYSIEFSVLLLSILLLLYFCFMLYAYHTELDSVLLQSIIQIITIPAIAAAFILPGWLVYRFQKGKVYHKKLAVVAFLVSIGTLVLLLVATFFINS